MIKTQHSPKIDRGRQITRRKQLEERFLVRQLPMVVPPDKLQRYLADLRLNYSLDARIDAILKEHGNRIALPPFPEEEKLYDDLIEEIESCRHREWRQQSRVNLVHFIAAYFMPELMSIQSKHEE